MPRETGFSVGNPDAALRILWLHGYTGAPGAFLRTAERLARELDAFVHAPLLPGHGTCEGDILGIGFEDFFAAAETAAHATRREDARFAVIGYSFGGCLAAHVARTIGADALVIALTPFTLPFPASLPGSERFMALRTFWNKYLTAQDVREREGTFYYPDVPGTSLGFVKRGNALMRETLPHIGCPILTLHNEGDPVARTRSGGDIIALQTPNEKSAAHVFPGGRHALFFRPGSEKEYDVLYSFLRGMVKK